jgi:hypothetical protein
MAAQAVVGSGYLSQPELKVEAKPTLKPISQHAQQSSTMTMAVVRRVLVFCAIWWQHGLRFQMGNCLQHGN